MTSQAFAPPKIASARDQSATDALYRARPWLIRPGEVRNPTGGVRKPAEFHTAVNGAFNCGGGQTWLLAWGKKNPTEFFRLCAKLIPQQVTVEVQSELAELIRAARQRRLAGPVQRQPVTLDAGPVLEVGVGATAAPAVSVLGQQHVTEADFP